MHSSSYSDHESADYVKALSSASDLVGRLRDDADAVEGNGRISNWAIEQLRERGLFGALKPRKYGGLELPIKALVDLGAVLASGCASTAWVYCNIACRPWILAMFSSAAQDEIWSNRSDPLIASALIFTAGKAERVPGGYRLSGRWPFSSGVDVCDWNMLAAIVRPADEAGTPEYRLFLIPRSSYEIIDNWDVAGLIGTGSKDVACENVFVPDHFSLDMVNTKGRPATAGDTNILPCLPLMALFPYCLSGVALGNADALFADYIESTRSRVARYGGVRLADFQSTQLTIARAGAEIDAARNIMRSACIEAFETATQGKVPDLNDKTRLRRDGAYAVELCTAAVDRLFAAMGAGGLYRRNRAQRIFRDAHAIAAHIAFNFDTAGALYGRSQLQIEVDNPTL